MKRVIALLLVVVLSFSLCACGGGNRSSRSSGSSHSCYVCGKSASHKYGSHYYCATHWAMVKTVDEAG